MSSKRKIPSKVDFKPIQRRRRSLLSKVLSLENCSDYSENITRVELDMQTEEKVAIIDKLKHHFILGSISEVQLAEILNTVFAVTCPKDHYLFHKGEQGYFFFIIHRGRVQVRIDSSSRSWDPWTPSVTSRCCTTLPGQRVYFALRTRSSGALTEWSTRSRSRS